jgi:hypothetical protein
MPFEEGARLLWEKVDDLEAMSVPILGDLQEWDLEKLKKEMLYTYLSSNTDYKEVLKDYHRFFSDYPTMYSHCVQVYSRLKPGAAADGNRGGNRGDEVEESTKAGGRSSLGWLQLRTPVVLPSPRLAKPSGTAGTPRRAKREDSQGFTRIH